MAVGVIVGDSGVVVRVYGNGGVETSAAVTHAVHRLRYPLLTVPCGIFQGLVVPVVVADVRMLVRIQSQ